MFYVCFVFCCIRQWYYLVWFGKRNNMFVQKGNTGGNVVLSTKRISTYKRRNLGLVSS